MFDALFAAAAETSGDSAHIIRIVTGAATGALVAAITGWRLRRPRKAGKPAPVPADAGAEAGAVAVVMPRKSRTVVLYVCGVIMAAPGLLMFLAWFASPGAETAMMIASLGMMAAGVGLIVLGKALMRRRVELAYGWLVYQGLDGRRRTVTPTQIASLKPYNSSPVGLAGIGSAGEKLFIADGNDLGYDDLLGWLRRHRPDLLPRAPQPFK
jgi:hypothetical protein